MKLIIVESPTKAKTITKFLGKGFKVSSSNGHIRDLPERALGVNTEKNFEPKYTILSKAKKTVKQLKDQADKAEVIVLATDEDREGEAIAWHLTKALKITKKQKTERIVFHEITKKAIEQALEKPRELDMDLVDAQQARRILDRLVGYKLSSFLRKKIAKGLSAGRVQSVAVRLIVDKEREIKAFKPEEYWDLTAYLQKEGSEEFTAKLAKKDNKPIPRLGLKKEKEVQDILKNLKEAQYQIKSIESKETKKNPLPPFITSTLQRAATNRLGFSAKQTMQIAQQLYEGIDLGSEGSVGLISYMRTDSTNLSQEALESARGFISQSFGNEYLPDHAVFYKTKNKSAQEAHEAIRPTQAERQPDKIKERLTPQQYKLYNLIWSRFIACQMKPALFNSVNMEIETNTSPLYTFRANGSSVKFDGWLKIYPAKVQENILPLLSEKDILDLVKLDPQQHFTQPPARYNEASLIKALEEANIGRPSTYAPIISTIQNRGYVIKNEQKRLEPTDTGFKVTDMLLKHFTKIIDIEFTAKMETSLDDVADGKQDWTKVVADFYFPFEKNLKEKLESVENQKLETPTDKVCPECGKPIVIKQSRFGKFYACSGFPECRYTEPINETVGVKCPKCKEGDVVKRRSKKGRFFYGCSRWPKCDYVICDKPTRERCPKCNSLIVLTRKEEKKCSNKECDWQPKE